MKTGANKQDINTIVAMAEAGDKAVDIADTLQINVKTVKSFMPKKEKEESDAK